MSKYRAIKKPIVNYWTGQPGCNSLLCMLLGNQIDT